MDISFLFSLIIAAVIDSINPCTLAVMILLLTTISLSKTERSVLLAGIGFSLSIFISYFLMGLGVYHAIVLGGISDIFTWFIIILAFVVGILSIRDYFDYTPGFLAVEIPVSWRPTLKKLISRVQSPIGATFIGFLCSLFLVPCSSGPYLVILGMLAKKALFYKAVLYLLLYNFIFILPMIIITLAIYFSCTNLQKLSELREKHIKRVHLISGILMIILGFIVLLNHLGVI